MLDDGYGIVANFAWVVYQHLHFIVQYSFAVWVGAKPLYEGALVFFILSVVVGRSGTFLLGVAAWSGVGVPFG